MTFEWGTESQPSEGRQREIHIQRLKFTEDENYMFYVTHQQMHIDKL